MINEKDYINITNLVKIRISREILFDLIIDDIVIERDIIKNMLKKLTEYQLELEKLTRD